MAQQVAAAQRQQDLQVQYSNYKDTLQALAQKIGDVEQEAEEHKYARPFFATLKRSCQRLARRKIGVPPPLCT
ncbi:Cochaperone prefoldin complex subunit [Teratosphaeriaceae sp. CCFEE 6253]|nr:Cochaperone prefoldin complex subunit [Teratosphaeriaceae sp. CCFEE 6253]